MQGELCNFLRGTHASGRNFFDQSGTFFVAEAAVHIGIDDTAGDGIDLNVARSKFLAKCAGKRIDSAFAGRVSDLTGGTDISSDRRNADDLSAFLLYHRRYAAAAGRKYRGQIGSNYMIPVFNLHICQQANVRDACIVD